MPTGAKKRAIITQWGASENRVSCFTLRRGRPEWAARRLGAKPDINRDGAAVLKVYAQGIALVDDGDKSQGAHTPLGAVERPPREQVKFDPMDRAAQHLALDAGLMQRRLHVRAAVDQQVGPPLLLQQQKLLPREPKDPAVAIVELVQSFQCLIRHDFAPESHQFR